MKNRPRAGGSGEAGRESEEETEAPIEEGTGEPPTSTTRPSIRVLEINGDEIEVVKKEAAAGQYLEATSGNWAGTRPISYEYQWLRCKDRKCASIAGARGFRCQLTEEDARSTLEVTVTARNGVKPSGVMTSEPSPVVKREGEGRKSKAESVKLTGGLGYLIDEFHGARTDATPYEVKLSSAPSSGGEPKRRVIIVTPLP